MMSKRDKVKVITKQYIVDQLSENEVDLSMSELTTVPVKELCLVTRGTRLDLSRNHLKLLPDNFGNLRHLIGLDLSGNRLQSLPKSFGQLVLLQRLDLYSNQIKSLPLSFGNLKKLKWLDLKNNPLEDGLREAAGTCVSSKECMQCATKVLAYMRGLQSQTDRDKQVSLQAQRLQEKARQEDEARRRDGIRKEKELRKRLKEEQLRQEQKHEEDRGGDLEVKEEEHVRHSYLGDADLIVEKGCCANIGRVCTVFMLLCLTFVLLAVLAVVTCHDYMDPARCQAIKVSIIRNIAFVLEKLGAKWD